jgi:antitoxin (DNA-binding transcriptional repressor) of toxin-antitoxin stability system
MSMGSRVIRVSESEAVDNFGRVLNSVRAGAEVVIECDARPVAVVRPAEPARRSVSECIALAEAHAKESGHEPTLDPDFAADLADLINNRQPWKPPAWE